MPIVGTSRCASDQVQSLEVEPALVGITTYKTTARWAAWNLPAALTPWAYVEAVAAAGGAPVLIPPSGPSDAVLARLDALVLCGGPDISPSLYAQGPAPESGPYDEDRDRFEFELTRSALALDLPILGICRGMQMLNVAVGGSLEQHLPNTPAHRAAPGKFASHAVRTTRASKLSQIIGPLTSVPSYHHQGLRAVADDLVATAVAPDGTVEAIEHRERTFAVGVLWHPEMSEDLSLFEALIHAACTRRVPR